MQKYHNNVLRSDGRPASGATITVTTAAGAAASLYSGDGEGLLSTNVITADASGEYSFYAANGRYTLQIAYGTYVSETRSDVILYDPDDVTAAVTVYTANQSVAPTTLTSGTTVSVNAALSNNFKLTLDTNATLANPTNLTDGMVLNFRIKQDTTGSRTLAYGSAYKFPGGTAPTLSTAAGAVDFMSCYYDGTDGVLACNMTKGYA
jgi:hypothetical protein